MCVISRQYRELDGITTHEQTSSKATGRSFESSKGLGRSSSSSFSFPPSFPPLERKKVKTWKRTRALKRSQKGGTYEREREREDIWQWPNLDSTFQNGATRRLSGLSLYLLAYKEEKEESLWEKKKKKFSLFWIIIIFVFFFGKKKKRRSIYRKDRKQVFTPLLRLTALLPACRTTWKRLAFRANPVNSCRENYTVNSERLAVNDAVHCLKMI